MVECRREIDVPSADLPAVIASLADLSARERRAAPRLPAGAVVEYEASLEIFDVAATGRGLAVWTGALAVPDLGGTTVAAYRDAAFADFLEQLRFECTLSRVS
ncbi:hypothetical protein [Mycolicibacterium phlei]